MHSYNLGNWEAQSLRCSVFPLEELDGRETEIWQSLMGSLPNEIRKQPQQHVTIIEGIWNRAWIRLELRSKQLDWRVIPNIQAAGQKLPVLGAYNQELADFQQLMCNWLNTERIPMNRIAFGATLWLTRETPFSTYQTLDDLLPSINIDPEKCRDFTYRINRRRDSESGVDGLVLNRLSTWSAVEVVRMHSDSALDESGVGQKQSTTYVCQLDLDINTVPSYEREIEKASLITIFNELVTAGNEIAVQGDIP